jgi:hypothetical protein
MPLLLLRRRLFAISDLPLDMMLAAKEAAKAGDGPENKLEWLIYYAEPASKEPPMQSADKKKRALRNLRKKAEAAV